MMNTAMSISRFLLPASLCFALALCSCGKTQEPPPPFAETLGDTPYGAPLAPTQADTGILKDQKTYNPAAFGPGGGPAAAGGGAGTVAATDAATAGRELLDNLLNDMESGEVDYVLDAFDPAQVEVVRGDEDFLYNTQDAYARLTRSLADALGDSSVEQLNSDLRKLVTDGLKVDPIDAQTVTITPNPLLIVLGPAKTTPAMTVALLDGEWHIRLEAALTTEDLDAMQAYHQKLQDTIYALVDALDSKAITERDAVYAALLTAATGGDVEIPTAEPATTEDEGEGETPPEEPETGTPETQPGVAPP